MMWSFAEEKYFFTNQVQKRRSWEAEAFAQSMAMEFNPEFWKGDNTELEKGFCPWKTNS